MIFLFSPIPFNKKLITKRDIYSLGFPSRNYTQTELGGYPGGGDGGRDDGGSGAEEIIVPKANMPRKRDSNMHRFRKQSIWSMDVLPIGLDPTRIVDLIN